MLLELKYFKTVLQVELLIPQLQFLDDEGAQLELWELSKTFLDTLIEQTKSQVSGMYSRSYSLIEMHKGFSEFIMIFSIPCLRTSYIFPMCDCMCYYVHLDFFFFSSNVH